MTTKGEGVIIALMTIGVFTAGFLLGATVVMQ
jgi:hypothetical protein